MSHSQQFNDSPPQFIAPIITESFNSQAQARNSNLNELMKYHRARQKYQIVDKFFNNSYISIENKLQTIEVYYHNDFLKAYLQDLALVYFKQMEFNENVRLEYVLRRLNYTLTGEHYNFKQFLQDSKFMEQVIALYSQQYLQQLQNFGNDKTSLNLRNNIVLAFLIDQVYSYNFSNEQIEEILTQIYQLYHSIQQTVSIGFHQQQQVNNKIRIEHNDIKCMTSQSERSFSYESDQESSEEQIKSHEQITATAEQNLPIFFDDLLYEEQIQLKILQVKLQNNYFNNQIQDVSSSEQCKIKLKYLVQINKQYMDKLKQLKQYNHQSRLIVKKIQRNIRIQLKTGVKCICLTDSDNLTECFGKQNQIHSLHQLNQLKLMKTIDTECIEQQLLNMITKLKLRVIADAIEKVFQINKEQNKQLKNQNNLIFSVTFEHGIGINQAIFNQKDFLKLNDLREESTLTSYLTPMKSRYSYISHNIYTFLRLINNDFPYDKGINNNEDILKCIRNKISKHKNNVKNNMKDLYYQNFRICHNCKILCHKQFLKQCKKKVRFQKYRDDDDQNQQNDDDSLYTQRNYRRRGSSPYLIQCQKNYCIYCIKNQFNGKLFNDKGWCLACLDACHCNTCLRERVLKKLVELFLYVGGQNNQIKTQKQIIDQMRIKSDQQQIQQSRTPEKHYSQLEERVYEAVIKREIMKGYSAEDIDLSLHQQKQIISLVVERERTKARRFILDCQLFRQKIGLVNDGFGYEHLDHLEKQERKRDQLQKTAVKTQQKQQGKLLLTKTKKRREKKALIKKQKRVCRKVKREEELYYDCYMFNEYSEQQSSFHIKHKKSKEKNYEPEYNF